MRSVADIHKVMLAGALATGIAVLGAQGADEGVQGAMDTATLPEITVNATRLTLDPVDLPYAYYSHDRTELNNAPGRTVLDRIDYGPGIIIQHTAPGQTSPFIRGLTGKQSLLLLDGVRLSHATMRGGPNEYSVFIPDVSVDSIDAILGSSSVVNGSDGLTGALDFRLAPAGRGVGKTISPWLGTRIDSANGAQTSGGIDGTTGDWRYSLEGSFYNFHDRIGGKDANDHVFGDGKAAYDGIPNTAYDQWSVGARAAYDGFLDRSIELSAGHTRMNDARRPDGYYENSGKESRVSRYYDPETFTYLHVRDLWTPDGLFFDQLTSTIWWHQFDEQQRREDLRDDETTYRRREYDNRIDSIGVEPQFTSLLSDHELTYGALVLFEKTDNAYREFRNAGGTEAAGAAPYKPEKWSANTTVTDGAEYNTYALYLQDLWKLTDRFSLLGGLRYTFVEWTFDVADNDADDLTGGLRASYQLNNEMLVFAGASKAFRAPNLSDLDGATDRGSSGILAFGNPDLDPEASYTGEAGWRYINGRDELGVSVFYTRIEDVIQRVYPAGDTAGTMENGEGADLHGVELLWDYGLPVPLGERLAFVGSVSLIDTEAEVPQPDGTILEEPMSRANRIYGRAGLQCDVDRNWWTRVQVRFHDDYDEDDLASGDSDDVRLTVPGNGDGTVDGYAVVDLSGGWVNNTGDRWVTLTLENVADKTYRQLGSGADASGFNVALAGGVRF